jgi:hypothetical protein
VAIQVFLIFCLGGQNKGENGEGVKGMKRFSVHFNLHKPTQIVFLKNLEN